MNILKFTPRTAGVLYLILILTGIYAQFFVRSGLIIPGNAAATANNITSSESLFRIGIASDLIMIICDVVLALIFYVLLKSVNKSLSLLAAFFRLIQAAILSVNLLNLFFALQLLNNPDYLNRFLQSQLNSLIMLFLNIHNIGYSIGLVFFGINCFIIGYLILKSGYIPKILGVLLLFASIGYLTDSFANVLLVNYKSYQDIFAIIVFVPALFAELTFCLWLIFKGNKIPESIYST